MPVTSWHLNLLLRICSMCCEFLKWKPAQLAQIWIQTNKTIWWAMKWDDRWQSLARYRLQMGRLRIGTLFQHLSWETDHSMKMMRNLMSYGYNYCSPLQNVILSACVMAWIVSSPNSHVGVMAPWNLRMWTIFLFGNRVFMEVIEWKWGYQGGRWSDTIIHTHRLTEGSRVKRHRQKVGVYKPPSRTGLSSTAPRRN